MLTIHQRRPFVNRTRGCSGIISLKASWARVGPSRSYLYFSTKRQRTRYALCAPLVMDKERYRRENGLYLSLFDTCLSQDALIYIHHGPVWLVRFTMWPRSNFQNDPFIRLVCHSTALQETRLYPVVLLLQFIGKTLLVKTISLIAGTQKPPFPFLFLSPGG